MSFSNGAFHIDNCFFVLFFFAHDYFMNAIFKKGV